MVMLTLLMRTANLDEATTMYKKVQVLLCSKFDTNEVKQAFDEVVHHINYSVPDEDDIPSMADIEDTVNKDTRDDGDHAFKNESAETMKTIREQSPFTRHFAHVLEDLGNDSDSTDTGNRNNMFNLAAFTVIADVVHLYPLWAAALHDDVRRFANDVTKSASKTPRPKCRSNAIVESHFKSVKHAQKNSYKLRPRLFLVSRLRSVLAKVNEAAIKFPNTRRKRRSTNKSDLASTPEVWNRTPKRRRYGDRKVSLRILEDANSRVVRKLKKVFFY
jgi:hypothetical protein